MIDQIKNRFREYSEDFKKKQNMDLIISKAGQCKVHAISYEEWLEKFTDINSRKSLFEFYEKAKKWNRID